MNILLDTRSFLWLTLDPGKIPARAMAEFENPLNTIFLSSVSSWEISIKFQLYKLFIPMPPEQFIPQVRKHQDIQSLQLTEKDSFHLHRLPAIHKDPFDRILICQAIENGMTMLTADKKIHKYPIRVYWA